MTVPEMLKLMRTLSALESASLVAKVPLPDFLREDIVECVEVLERAIVTPQKM